MTKIKNPGFLSDDERSYLRSIEADMNPRLYVVNPSRARARILEFQEGLHKAIDSFVEDVRLMQFTGKRYEPEEIVHQFSGKDIGSELARCVKANRIGALKFFFSSSPLSYLLIACLDALTKHTDDQRQASMQVIRLCLKVADVVQEEAEKHPELLETVSYYEDILRILEMSVKVVRDDLSKVGAEVDWLLEHPDAKEVFLTVYLESDPEDERKAWVHRDRIAHILEIPGRKTTRLLSALARRGLVERDEHRYRMTEKGDMASLAIALRPESRMLFGLPDR